MAEGQLRCVGSSLFLKKTYGVGYQLTIEKQPVNKKALAKISEVALGEGAEDGATHVEMMDEKLSDIVTGAVTDASLLSSVGTELSFQLPLGAASKFMPMFDQLDEEVESGGIVTYGVGITTLDEVFLLVARGDSTHESKRSFRSSRRLEVGAAVTDDAEKSVRSRMDLENDGLFTRHVMGLFQKRAVNFKRDKKAWCCTTILPSMFVLGGLLLFAYAAPQRNLKPITLDINDYNMNIAQEPKHPINFNSAGSQYSCSPGSCIYEIPFIENEGTGESYTFCGGVAAALATNLTCTISESNDLLSKISGSPLGDDSTNGLEVRMDVVVLATLSVKILYLEMPSRC
jgi:ATP-binding cassette, subfamily A (ABC1), member 3